MAQTSTIGCSGVPGVHEIISSSSTADSLNSAAESVVARAIPCTQTANAKRIDPLNPPGGPLVWKAPPMDKWEQMALIKPQKPYISKAVRIINPSDGEELTVEKIKREMSESPLLL